MTWNLGQMHVGSSCHTESAQWWGEIIILNLTAIKVVTELLVEEKFRFRKKKEKYKKTSELMTEF